MRICSQFEFCFAFLLCRSEESGSVKNLPNLNSEQSTAADISVLANDDVQEILDTNTSVS